MRSCWGERDWRRVVYLAVAGMMAVLFGWVLCGVG